MRQHDEGYSRIAMCALNQIPTFWIQLAAARKEQQLVRSGLWGACWKDSNPALISYCCCSIQHSHQYTHPSDRCSSYM